MHFSGAPGSFLPGQQHQHQQSQMHFHNTLPGGLAPGSMNSGAQPPQGGIPNSTGPTGQNGGSSGGVRAGGKGAAGGFQQQWPARESPVENGTDYKWFIEGWTESICKGHPGGVCSGWCGSSLLTTNKRHVPKMVQPTHDCWLLFFCALQLGFPLLFTSFPDCLLTGLNWHGPFLLSTVMFFLQAFPLG
jgi:hypothetical protein